MDRAAVAAAKFALLAQVSAVLLLGSVFAAEVFDPGGPVSVITGTPKFTSLTANTALHLNASKILTADTLTNGQLLIGSTGASPAIGAPTGSGNLTVTLGAGTIALDTVQGIQASSSPTFSGLTLTGGLSMGGGLSLTGSSGIQIGAPTGGDKGAGTINAASGYFANGTAGSSVTKTVRASGGAADCTLIFAQGLLTGGSC